MTTPKNWMQMKSISQYRFEHQLHIAVSNAYRQSGVEVSRKEIVKLLTAKYLKKIPVVNYGIQFYASSSQE